MAYTTHPGTWDNCVMYLPSPALYPGAFWQDTVGGTPAGVGDSVGAITSGVGSWVWDSPSNKPTRTADGALQFGIASNTYLRLNNSGAHTKVLHENGMYYMIRFRMNETMGSGSGRILFDSTNLSTTTRGVRVSLANDDTITTRVNNNNAGSPVLSLLTTDAIPNDTLDHVVKGQWTPGPGKGTAQIDIGTKVFATPGTPSAGDAGNMFVGNRLSQDRALLGRIYEMWVGTAPPTAAQEAEWDAHNPIGSVAGNAVLETPTLRVELIENYARVVAQPRWDGNLIGSASGSEGTVYRIGDIWYGSVHSVDVGSQPETVNSTAMWLDGAEEIFTSPLNYKANSQFKFRRITTINPAFELNSTITGGGNRFSENLQLTRKNDGNTLAIVYALRSTRGGGYTPYRFIDAAGEVVASGTLTTDGANDAISERGVPACAQFDAASGVMVLSVLKKGTEYGTRLVLFGASGTNRLYHRCDDMDGTDAAAGAVFKFNHQQRYYYATSETWVALAQSETAKLLATSKVKQRIGIGIGIGL